MTAPAAHLDDDTLERLAMGELDAPARADALAHVAACPTCSRMWMALRSLEVSARAIDPAVVATDSGLDADRAGAGTPSSGGAHRDDEVAARRRRNAQYLVVGGLFALAAAIALFVIPGRTTPAELAGGDGSMRGDRGATIDARVTGETSGPGLTWTPVAEADAYQISIHTADGRPARPPIEALAPPVIVEPALAPGRYRWRVEAVRGGRVVAHSRLIELVVTP
jgi:hypothetical protein